MRGMRWTATIVPRAGSELLAGLEVDTTSGDVGCNRIAIEVTPDLGVNHARGVKLPLDVVVPSSLIPPPANTRQNPGPELLDRLAAGEPSRRMTRAGSRTLREPCLWAPTATTRPGARAKGRTLHIRTAAGGPPVRAHLPLMSVKRPGAGPL